MTSKAKQVTYTIKTLSLKSLEYSPPTRIKHFLQKKVQDTNNKQQKGIVSACFSSLQLPLLKSKPFVYKFNFKLLLHFLSKKNKTRLCFGSLSSALQFPFFVSARFDPLLISTKKQQEKKITKPFQLHRFLKSPTHNFQQT